MMSTVPASPPGGVFCSFIPSWLSPSQFRVPDAERPKTAGGRGSPAPAKKSGGR